MKVLQMESGGPIARKRRVEFLGAAAQFFKVTALKINLVVFFFFSLLISLITEKLPEPFYNYKRKLYRTRKWEKGGRFYERIFFVKKWKDKLPEFSDFVRVLFSKRHIRSTNDGYLKLFLAESCKAEFTHWLIIASSFLFLFWNDLLETLKIIFVAAFLNIPYIIIQRYNRPRLVNLLHKFRRDKVEVPSASTIEMK